MGYLLPVSYRGLCSWQTHRNRTPPSSEAGTDLYCSIGTPVYAAAGGWVVDRGDSIYPATGRFITLDLDDGRRCRYLHLSAPFVTVGQRVERGTLIGLSGATGYGVTDWSDDSSTGGAHVHLTLWRTQRYLFGDGVTLDPMAYFTDPAPGLAGGGAYDPNIDPEEAELSYLTDLIGGMSQTLTRLEARASRKGGAYSFVNVVDGGIVVQSLISGKRVRIENPYHAGLLDRAQESDFDSPQMLSAELDIVEAYLVAINPPATAEVDSQALADTLSKLWLERPTEEQRMTEEQLQTAVSRALEAHVIRGAFVPAATA